MNSNAYPNVGTEGSQNNFLQQQNPPRTQPQQQKHQFQYQQPLNQSIPSQFVNYQMNQPGSCYPINPQPCQPNLGCPNPQPIQNPCQTQYQMSYNPATAPITSQSVQQPCGSLSPAILEQIRNACLAPTGPIFILPNNSPPAPVPSPSVQQTMGQMSNCPGMRVPCGTPSPVCYSPPSCIPYPVPMPIFSPFGAPASNMKETISCNCNTQRNNDPCKAHTCSTDYCREHYCIATTDDTICAKKSCPSSINLQALASQLLAIQGIISCAATRLVLRKVPGSNVTNSMDETLERARRSINVLTQDQLLAESRNAHQINALINLHMTANPPQNVIPILTTIQLKVNLLKSHVEKLINCNLMENQSVGAEGSKCLDVMTLSLKCDKDLRTMLATLRQKECDERVNFNFAPYHSQRVIAECRLRNIESKIRQVESEMNRRRCMTVSSVPVRYEDPSVCSRSWYSYPGTLPYLTPLKRETIPQPQCYESPDPFQIEVRNTRRLNLKPHVGSPETTYSHAARPMHNPRESVCVQQNNVQNVENKNEANEQQSVKEKKNQDENMEDDDDYNDDDDDCDCCCDCSNSSDDDSPDEDKKKLRVRMRRRKQDDGDTKNEKKKVDFVQGSFSTHDIKNNIMPAGVTIDMETPGKETDALWINASKNDQLDTGQNGNGVESNIYIVNTNINENSKDRIILLHDSRKLKLHQEISPILNGDSENPNYLPSFTKPVENIVSHGSCSDTENNIAGISIKTLLDDKNSLNTSKSVRNLPEYKMDCAVEDSWKNTENSANDAIEMTECKDISRAKSN